MRATSLLAVVLCSLRSAECKACQGEDLPPESSLRVGSKYKPENCGTLSKKGDRVRIGYEASLYSNCSQLDSSYFEGWEVRTRFVA